jgi:hypothetical protein
LGCGQTARIITHGLWAFVLVVALLGLATACSSKGKGAQTLVNNVQATNTPRVISPEGQATSTATATTTATPTVTATATASPTPTPGGDTDSAAIAAATSELKAKYVSPLSPDSCAKDNPDGQLCIELKSSAADTSHGAALFNAGDPSGGGFVFAMGRTLSGEWHYWFGTQQQTYHLLSMPGSMIVCADGTGAHIRSAPETDADEVTLVKDLTTVQVSNFVLTQPGTYGASGATGDGWYQVTAPANGWIDARYVANSSLGNCALRDALESNARG